MVEYIKQLYDNERKEKNEPSICKNCIVKSCCTRNYMLGTMCEEALREYINMMFDEHQEYVRKEKEKNGNANKKSND